MDYGKTINLPNTEFPMRANLPQREPEFLKNWDKEEIYFKILEKNKDKEHFILHDGPPYANGHIHLGHALNKILKDIIVRYKSLRGYYAPYVPGWDTHGLPIEQQVIKMGVDRKGASIPEFREKCKEFALKQVGIQREEFKRLGVLGDWEHPYVTLNKEFEAKQIEVFGEMAKKGYIYKGLRPVYWCSSCETALAEAEIEYGDKRSPSIYVKFKLLQDNGQLLQGLKEKADRIYAVIWTTTPWTIPANVAISVNPAFEYVLVEAKEDIYIIAKELLDSFVKEVGLEGYTVLKTIKGESLEGLKFKHPLFDRESLMITGDHVTLDAGTGCVHTAPGHGMEDYEVCKGYDLPIIMPVNDQGVMTKEAGPFEGLHVEKANKPIVEALDACGSLLKMDWITHQYPHCWRCHKPVIFRATNQWFASIDGFRKEAVEEARKVEWIPKWGEDRLISMVEDRGDWCISRQRVWGVPIPIFYCRDCGKEIITEETIQRIKELFRKEGSDIWFKLDAKEILPEGFTCPDCGGTEFSKEQDIMDVWFDSGSSHYAVLDTRDDLSWPADLYLEGNDQYRGWFQSSLLTATAVGGKSPYGTVITHGMVVDGDGKKMSKSLGNGIDPLDLVKKFGADIVRLWVSSADYRADVRVSNKIISQLTEVYRKIRNTIRFLISNLSDFDVEKDSIAYEDMSELDKLALLKLNGLIERVTEAYDSYDFHVVYHAIHHFCVVDMSNFYLDILKDRLYILEPDHPKRRSAQTVLYQVLVNLTKLIAPILSFTADEIWQFMNQDIHKMEESIMLTDWPKADERYNDKALEEKWDAFADIRMDVNKALEITRRDKVIGQSLEAKVTLYVEEEKKALFDSLGEELKDLFIVSECVVKDKKEADGTVHVGENGILVKVEKAEGEKCERCWTYTHDVGEHHGYQHVCARCGDVLHKLNIKID